MLSSEGESVYDRHKESNVKVAARTVFICSVVYVGIGVFIGSILKDTQCVEVADRVCMDRISRYSPVMNEVRPDWYSIRFNSSFLHQNINNNKRDRRSMLLGML